MARPAIDIKGVRYGILTAKEVVLVKGVKKWRCVCDCGGEAIVTAGRLRMGDKRSCGCLIKTPSLVIAPDGLMTLSQIANLPFDYKELGLNKAYFIIKHDSFPSYEVMKFDGHRTRLKVWDSQEVFEFFNDYPMENIRFNIRKGGLYYKTGDSPIDETRSYFSNPLLGLARMFYQSLNQTIYA